MTEPTIATAILGSLAAMMAISTAVYRSLWIRAENVVTGYRLGGADARVKRLTDAFDKARLDACNARATAAMMRADRDAALAAIQRWNSDLRDGKFILAGGDE